MQGQRGVECFVKIVPMMPGAEPGRAGERNWRTWAYIVLDQLTLAVGEAAGSDGHFAALMVARWAFLFGTALYRLENERFPPPAGQHADDLVDHSIRYTLDVAMAQLLVGAHGVRMIDQWLDMLTPASVVGGADWEIAHFGEQYHVLAPVTQQGQRNELVGQYSEIFKGLRAALYVRRSLSFFLPFSVLRQVDTVLTSLFLSHAGGSELSLPPSQSTRARPRTLSR